MSRANIGWTLHNMIAAAAGITTAKVIHKSEDGITLCYATASPGDAVAGYAEGCICIVVNGSGGAVLYVNEGTALVSDFNLIITEDNINAQVDVGFPPYGSASGRGPSSLIWSNCPVLDYQLDPTKGYVYFNDFVGDNIVLAANKTAADLGGGVSGFTGASGGSTIAMNADEPTGVVTLKSTTDNEDAGICILGGLNTAGQIKISATKKFWFEARIKSLNITDAKFGIFCGLAEEGLNAAGTLITVADALPDKDYVGFHKLAADGDKLDTVHRKTSGAAVTVKADAVTLVADTYKKIGIYSDGTTVTFYADGVALADVALTATATFPKDEELAFYFVAMNAHGDDAESSIDWVRIAQEF